MLKIIVILLSIASIYATEVSLKSMYHNTNFGPLHRLKLSKPNKTPYKLKSTPGITYRPSNTQELFQISQSRKLFRFSSVQQTTLRPVPYLLPDVTDHDTVLSLGYMSYDAYMELGKEGTWYDLGKEWGIVSVRKKKGVFFYFIHSYSIEFNIWLGT